MVRGKTAFTVRTLPESLKTRDSGMYQDTHTPVPC